MPHTLKSTEFRKSVYAREERRLAGAVIGVQIFHRVLWRRFVSLAGLNASQEACPSFTWVSASLIALKITFLNSTLIALNLQKDALGLLNCNAKYYQKCYFISNIGLLGWAVLIVEKRPWLPWCIRSTQRIIKEYGNADVFFKDSSSKINGKFLLFMDINVQIPCKRGHLRISLKRSINIPYLSNMDVHKWISMDWWILVLNFPFFMVLHTDIGYIDFCGYTYIHWLAIDLKTRKLASFFDSH